MYVNWFISFYNFHKVYVDVNINILYKYITQQLHRYVSVCVYVCICKLLYLLLIISIAKFLINHNVSQALRSFSWRRHWCIWKVTGLGGRETGPISDCNFTFLIYEMKVLCLRIIQILRRPCSGKVLKIF